MTNREYRKRCSELRRLIRGAGTTQSDTFALVHHGRTRFIYNKRARNIIYKDRRGQQRVIGIQYRATSIYRPVLERVKPVEVEIAGLTIRRLASPNMSRQVRQVRERVENSAS